MTEDSLREGAIKHLEDALEAEEGEKNFHIRAALQLLAVREDDS